MDPLRLPIDDTMVSQDLPPAHLVLLARYLTAGNGKDRRLGTLIRNPRTYALGIVTRRARDLAEQFEDASEEMEQQIAVWLRCARPDSSADEPSVGSIVEWYLTGSISGHRDLVPALTPKQTRDVLRATLAIVGHWCDRNPACQVCGAALGRRWDDYLDWTATDPQLVRELYRGFRAAGYPGLRRPQEEFMF